MGHWTGATCPTCGAPTGQRCETLWGGPLPRSHDDRLELADAEPQPVPDEAQQRWEATVATLKPQQLALARLVELTPELRAHYACPADIDCDHPLCQP